MKDEFLIQEDFFSFDITVELVIFFHHLIACYGTKMYNYVLLKQGIVAFTAPSLVSLNL